MPQLRVHGTALIILDVFVAHAPRRAASTLVSSQAFLYSRDGDFSMTSPMRQRGASPVYIYPMIFATAA